MTTIRMPIPRTRWNFELNSFDFSVSVKLKRFGSRVSLISKFDGLSHIDINYIPINALKSNGSITFARDLPKLEKRFGPIEILFSESGETKNKFMWRSKDRIGIWFLQMSDEGGIFISGNRPIGDLAGYKQLTDTIINSIRVSGVRLLPATKWSVKIFGSVDTYSYSRKAKLCVDILVRAKAYGLYIHSVIFQPPQADSSHSRIFQGRQLQMFSRVIEGECVNWHSTVLANHGHAIIQLPVICYPKSIQLNHCHFVICGWSEDGYQIKERLPLNNIMPAVLLQSPVPETWMMLNRPEHVSIHRLAVSLRDDNLFASQRGAVDFKSPDSLIKNDKGYLANKNFPSFGEPVKAPCDGRIIHCESDFKDQLPGNFDHVNPRGNQICIQTDQSEIIVLAHLQKGSVKVKKNDRVHKGEIIAAVGNSGNSSEPHLHIHAADSYSSEANGTLISFF